MLSVEADSLTFPLAGPRELCWRGSCSAHRPLGRSFSASSRPPSSWFVNLEEKILHSTVSNRISSGCGHTEIQSQDWKKEFEMILIENVEELKDDLGKILSCDIV